NIVRIYGVKRVILLRERLCYVKLLKFTSRPDLCLLSKFTCISDTFRIDIKADYSAAKTFSQVNCIASGTATYFQNRRFVGELKELRELIRFCCGHPAGLAVVLSIGLQPNFAIGRERIIPI